MNWDEYNILFHKLKLNRVAFKEVIDCSEEILTLVNAAIDAAAQEKKPWVGLTDDEFDAINPKLSLFWFHKAIEAILKEKNT